MLESARALGRGCCLLISRHRPDRPEASRDATSSAGGKQPHAWSQVALWIMFSFV